MVYLNIDRVTYENFKLRLIEFRPGTEIELIWEDYNLERLGFCRYAPCKVKINLTKAELDELMEELAAASDQTDPADYDPYWEICDILKSANIE